MIIDARKIHPCAIVLRNKAKEFEISYVHSHMPSGASGDCQRCGETISTDVVAFAPWTPPSNFIVARAV